MKSYHGEENDFYNMILRAADLSPCIDDRSHENKYLAIKHSDRFHLLTLEQTEHLSSVWIFKLLIFKNNRNQVYIDCIVNSILLTIIAICLAIKFEGSQLDIWTFAFSGYILTIIEAYKAHKQVMYIKLIYTSLMNEINNKQQTK